MKQEETAIVSGGRPALGELWYFQYRRGVVPEWSRFVHIHCSASDSFVMSWCRQSFQTDEVEECAWPGSTSGLSSVVRACTDCELTFAFRRSSELLERHEERGIPARIDTPGQMVSALRLLRDDLDYEAQLLPHGDINTARLSHLATEAENFARALRRFCWLVAAGARE